MIGFALTVILSIVLIGLPDTKSGCQQVPKPAEAALRRAIETLVRGQANGLKDWEGSPVGLGWSFSCRDAIFADFDGDGTEDAVAYYAFTGTEHGVLASAFSSGGAWRASVIEIMSPVNHLSLLPPGEYRRNPAITRELRPGEKAVAASRLPGACVPVVARPGSCLAFFLGRHRWVFVETECQ